MKLSFLSSFTLTICARELSLYRPSSRFFLSSSQAGRWNASVFPRPRRRTLRRRGNQHPPRNFACRSKRMGSKPSG
jgi:hypothetical protein